MIARLRKKLEEKEEGFTLIELLVVIIIIGILAAIAIPVFLSQRSKGNDAQAKSDLKNIATSEESALTDSNAYISCASASVCAGTSASGLGTQGYKNTSGVKVGVVASGNTGYCAIAQSASGNWFYYDSTNGGLKPGTPSTAFSLPTGGSCGGSGMTAASVG